MLSGFQLYPRWVPLTNSQTFYTEGSERLRQRLTTSPTSPCHWICQKHSYCGVGVKLIYQDFRDVIIRLGRLNKSEQHVRNSRLSRIRCMQLT